MSSGSYSSYSSSDTAKEPRDDIDEACQSEIPDVLYDRVEKVSFILSILEFYKTVIQMRGLTK